jgi:hypothetical protein
VQWISKDGPDPNTMDADLGMLPNSPLQLVLTFSSYILAAQFRELILKMPNSAVPVTGEDNLILEFPLPFPGAVTGRSIDSVDSTEARVIDESFDRGHRHYSGMHWLYPNIFHTTNTSLQRSLYNAAKITLDSKRSDGGGHTSWSAGWEAALYARLGDGESSFQSIQRILMKFSAANMLSLHPALIGKEIANAECITCFQELITPISGADVAASPQRGMTTVTDAKFQLDGNLAITAAICEMLVQSHMMGAIHLLPALPISLQASGSFSGIRTRGSGRVSLAWSHGNIDAAVVDIKSYHPWWGNYSEASLGFFDNHPSSSESRIILISPNDLVPLHQLELGHGSLASCVKLEEVHGSKFYDFASRRGKKRHLQLTIRSYPCSIHLCNRINSFNSCNRTISSILRT